MNDSATRYPLTWPSGWTRTPPHRRERASFAQTKSVNETVGEGQYVTRKKEVRVTVIVATQRLERQLELLSATHPILSTNVQLRLDGRPRSDSEPADPGAACYFRLKGKARVLACDKWNRVADNIAAIAQHIDALRRIDRYGVGSLEQAFAGYKALPEDTAANWRAVFGFAADSTPSFDDVDRAFKKAARERHPDAGGTDLEMAHLNRARDYAREELRG